MILEYLLIGLPDERPGGLLLSFGYFLTSAGGAVIAGLGYATLAILSRRLSMALQGVTAVLRGIPLLLLVFLLANLPGLTTGEAALLGLLLYSFSHVSEILRGFVTAYPADLQEQARVMGLSYLRELLELRFPWTLWHALPALLTHWISLLKDTGALVVVGIGELTTVAKILGESAADFHVWATVLGSAAGLYLITTLTLIGVVELMTQGINRSQRTREAFLVSEL